MWLGAHQSKKGNKCSNTLLIDVSVSFFQVSWHAEYIYTYMYLYNCLQKRAKSRLHSNSWFHVDKSNVARNAMSLSLVFFWDGNVFNLWLAIMQQPNTAFCCRQESISSIIPQCRDEQNAKLRKSVGMSTSWSQMPSASQSIGKASSDLSSLIGMNLGDHGEQLLTDHLLLHLSMTNQAARLPNDLCSPLHHS